VINHKLTNDSDGGTTTVKVKATVYNEVGLSSIPVDGDIAESSGTSSSSVTVPSSFLTNDSTKFIKVELTTTLGACRYFKNSSSFGLDNFNYVGTGVTTESDFNRTYSAVTYSFSFPITSLFSGEGSTQSYYTLNYTSPVTTTPQATYEFNYNGRGDSGSKSLTIPGAYMSNEEYDCGSGTSHYDDGEYTAYWDSDISVKLNNNIQVFRRVFSIGTTTYDSSTNTFNITCTDTDPDVTLTYYYPSGASVACDSVATTIDGNSVTLYVPQKAALASPGSVTGKFGTKAFLGSLLNGKGVSASSTFYAWMEYDETKHTIGNIVSVYPEFNYCLSTSKKVIAVYSSSAYAPTAGWHAYIDENKVMAEPDSSDANGGRYYNDTLIRFTNYSADGSVTDLGEDTEYGVMMIYKSGDYIDTTPTLNAFCTASDGAYIPAVFSRLLNNAVKKFTTYKVRAYRLNAASVSNLNRAVMSIMTNYNDCKGGDYAVVAYLKYSDGGDTKTVFSKPVYGDYN
jgi:hypothetical protein